MMLPILAAALPEKQRQKLLDATRVVERCLEVGSIPNPVYQDLKGVVASSIEMGWKAFLMKPYVYAGRYEGLPLNLAPLHDQLAPQTHLVAGYLRKARAVRSDHQFHADMIAFLEEILPLAEGVARLKGMVKKREVRPPQEVERGYRPPPVGTNAQAQVLALLEDVTAAAHAEVQAGFNRLFNRYLVDFMAADRIAQAKAEPPLEPYRYYNKLRTKTFNPEAYDIVEKVTHSEGRGKPWLPKPFADDIIATEAAEAADTIRRGFVHKNFAKIAAICDRKGNLAYGEIISRRIDMGGLSGTLRFGFEDGSRFTVQNAVVWSQSVHGKPFRRFPLTFHDVHLPDGSRLARPDEENMNEEFATTVVPALKL